MHKNRKESIGNSFGQKSHNYHNNAHNQKIVAQKLANMLPQNSPANILEIGCGTGFLTEELLRKYPQSKIHATDISHEMLQYTQQRFIGYRNLNFLKQDGENLDLNAQYDLIVTSMVLQWFDDPNNALTQYKNLLKPNGEIYFAALGAHSFEEWRDCLKILNLSTGLLEKHCYDGVCEEESEVISYKSGIDFLKSFKNIGAHQSNLNHTPLKPNELLRACSLLEVKYNSSVTWHVQYGKICKKD